MIRTNQIQAIALRAQPDLRRCVESMNVMSLVLAVSLASAASLLAQEQATNLCPVCHGATLIPFGTIRNDTNSLARNWAIWNQSICGDPCHNDESPVCTNCWYAFNVLGKDWELFLPSTNGFHFSLRKEIVDFPLPAKDSGRYEQTVSPNSIIDRISMWTELDPDYEAKVREYCESNKVGLELNKHRSRGQMLVIGGVRTRIIDATPPLDGCESYVVKEGDTLTGIARRFTDRDNLKEIVARNHLSDVNRIRAGDRLWIKRPSGRD